MSLEPNTCICRWGDLFPAAGFIKSLLTDTRAYGTRTINKLLEQLPQGSHGYPVSYTAPTWHAGLNALLMKPYVQRWLPGAA